MKIGFIGAGNMGGALARAVFRANCGAELWIADTDTAKAEALATSIGGRVASGADLVLTCDYLFLGVKPQVLGAVLGGLRSALATRTDLTLISMAAGVTAAAVQEKCGVVLPVIRIMPNTAVDAGEGMILYTCTPEVCEAARADFSAMLAAAGKLDEIPEGLIDAGSAVTGCGPAFAYLFIEALADAGVECGLPRDKAERYALQMLRGAATLCAVSGRKPGELKDAVCSPAGSTIAGVHALEAGGFRAAAMNAVQAAYRRTKELGK